MKFARAAMVVGALGVAGGATAYSWPLWADSYAETEAREWLGRRFDKVAIGQFELERHRATLRDVVVSDEGASARIDEIVVVFEMSWDRRVDVSLVAVTGGSVKANLDDLRERAEHDASQSIEAEAQPSRVTHDKTKLSVDGVHVSLSGDDSSAEAILAAETRGEIVTLTLTNGRVAARGREGSFETATTSFHRENIFPLTVKIADAATEVTPEIPVSAVSGEITFDDREATNVWFDLQGLGRDGKAAWSMEGIVDRSREVGDITIDTGTFSLGQLPDLYAALPVLDSEAAKVSVHATVKWSEGEYVASGEMSVEGVTVHHPTLATEPIRDVSFSGSAEVIVKPAQRRVDITQARLRRGKVVVNARGVVSDGEDERYDILVAVPDVPCQDALDALPRDLVPGLRGFELDGTFGMNFNVVVVPSDPSLTELRGDVGIDGCKVKKVPIEVEVLNGAFAYEVRRKDGVVQSILIADGSASFTSLDQITPAMSAAVMTTEDGGFWKHDGFLRSQFEASLRRNVELGRIKRGASTLTMQMVKNVLLSHERTLSRKIQELFLTWIVEGRLTKKRIMEIYLNVVEFGPGIYGVTAAAQHYFGKHPSELNGKEAAFLATMLPSPVRRHDQWCRGELTEKYAAKVNRVFKFMHDRRRIDDVAWEQDRDTPIVFDLQEWPGEKACRADDAALLKAKGVQWAESGLLAGRSDGVSSEFSEEDLPEEVPGEL